MTGRKNKISYTLFFDEAYGNQTIEARVFDTVINIQINSEVYMHIQTVALRSVWCAMFVGRLFFLSN